MRVSLITLFVFITTLFAYSQNNVAFSFGYDLRTARADCGGIVSLFPHGTFAIVRTRNGVTTTIPVPAIPTNHGIQYETTLTVQAGDVYEGVLTLPDGKKVPFDSLLGPESNLVYETSRQMGVNINAVEEDVCSDGNFTDYAGGAR